MKQGLNCSRQEMPPKNGCNSKTSGAFANVQFLGRNNSLSWSDPKWITPQPVAVLDLGAAAGGEKGQGAMVIRFIPAYRIEQEAAVVCRLVAQGPAVAQVVWEVSEIARGQGRECP